MELPLISNTIGVKISLLLAASLFGYVLVLKTGMLTRWGAIYAIGLGLLLYLAGGWIWLLAAFTFLVLSSLWTRWPGRTRKESRTRKAVQVAANGFIPALGAIISLVGYHDTGFAVMAGGFCAVAADTWATEWGKGFGGNPLSLRTFRVTTKGESGAISLMGTLASIAGAASVAIVFYFGINLPTDQCTRLVIAGFAGGIVDSFAGAWLQAFWKDRTGKIHEEKQDAEVDAVLVRGVPWINNDVVNGIAALSGAIVAIFLLN